MKKKIFRFLLWFIIVLVLFIGGAFIAIRYPAVQTYLAQRATAYLSYKLGTKVTIGRVKISFFNKAAFENFYMEDLNGDTLIYSKELAINVKLFKLFDKDIRISKVSLDEGTLHLHRDSTGKHMNLLELFSKLSSPKTETIKDTSAFTWHIDLNEVTLNKTYFRFLDEKGHFSLRVKIPVCNVELNQFAADKKKFNIESLKIDGAEIAVDLLKHQKKDDDSIAVIHFLPEGMEVNFDELAITNSRFNLSDKSSDSIFSKGMDFKHLALSEINIQMLNGKIVRDTITTELKKFYVKDRSGFTLENISANARVSTSGIQLSNLDLKTTNSRIKNYLALRFNAFHDFKNFMDAVHITADFNNTSVSLRDVNFFVHTLDKIEHNRILISGKLQGTVNNIDGKNVEIRTGNYTVLRGDIFAHGLPNIFETSINVRVKELSTTASDIRNFYPALKLPENMNTLGLITYTGSLDGFLTDFVSDGKLVTAIGSATTDVNFKYDSKKVRGIYKGNLALNDFDLGKYFNDEVNFGKISLQSQIDGSGLTPESLKAHLEGNVSSIVLRGYDYRDIHLQGDLLKKSFSGDMLIRDDYLDMDFSGKVDLTNEKPELRFQSQIHKAVLKNLNLSKQDIRIKGKMVSDFTGSRIDDIVGYITLNDVDIYRDSIEAFVDHIRLDANFLEENKKKLTLKSEVAEGELIGKFKINQLPKSLLNFAYFTFTKNYVDTFSHNHPQAFTLDVRVFEPGALTRIIHPKLFSLNNTRITGDYNSENNVMHLTGFIPKIQFDSFSIRKTNIDITSENGFFDLRAVTDKVFNRDSLVLDTLQLLTKTQENKDLRFDVLLADKRKYNYANITSYLTPLEGKALVRVDPSDVKLANYNWKFDPNNYILIDGKKITSYNLIFRSKEQTVYINSFLKRDTSTCIKITLDNTSISDFTGIFTSKMRELHGNVNGFLEVDDIFYKPKIFADMVADEFTLDKELIGDVNIESRLDESGKNILVYASIKSVNNNIEARGNISLDKVPSMKIEVNAQRLGLNFLNYKFFARYVRDCKGYATAICKIEGPLKKPLLTGDAWLVDDTVTVSFLNTRYHLFNQHALLDEHGFNFSNITVYDVNNNPIYCTHGRINHESFRNFALDIKVNTPKAQFLNTTEKQSPGFYGVAYGKGTVVFAGDINTPKISAYAETQAGTWCKLPITTSYETNRYSFYKFTNSKATVPETKVPPKLKLTGVNFSLDLDVTPEARMDIILDPVAGDVLTSYGRGNLKISIPQYGSTTMYGTYEIDRGKYLFTLQSIINKEFEINKGGTINFTGDVYKAALNVDAVYSVRTSAYTLIEDLLNVSQGTGNNNTQSQLAATAKSRIPVSLLLNLTGVLAKPTIAFDIKTIDADPSIKSYLDQKLTLLKNNENELNKQVFGLLVMKQFLPQNFLSQNNTAAAPTSGNYVGGTAANTVSEFFSAQLSHYLNSLLSSTEIKALQNLDINFRYRQYDELNTATNSNSGTTNPPSTYDTRRELQLALQQRLLNNRLIINAGGNLDFGNSTVYENNGAQTGAKTVIPTGDFQIEYLLTPDGVWRAKAFNRTNYDYYNSRNTNRTGIGLSYRQEFDKVKELFEKRKKKEKK